STIGPAISRMTSTALSASSSNIARARAGSRIAVRPGAASTAASQSFSRENDDVPIRLHPLRSGHDAAELFQLQVHDLALDRGHRLELDLAPGHADLLRRPLR